MDLTLVKRPHTVVSFDLGFRNLGVWIGHYDRDQKPLPDGFPFRFLHWTLVDLGASCTTSRDAVDRMVPLFDRTPKLWKEVDECLIELQDPGKMVPGRKLTIGDIGEVNRRKAFEEFGRAIHCYYKTKGIPVTYISSANKLKILPTMEGEKTETREQRKATAVKHVRRMFEIASLTRNTHLAPYRRWFESLQQKHDVADAFLQAAHFLIRGALADSDLLNADGRTISKRKLEQAERNRENLFIQIQEMEKKVKRSDPATT